MGFKHDKSYVVPGTVDRHEVKRGETPPPCMLRGKECEAWVLEETSGLYDPTNAGFIGTYMLLVEKARPQVPMRFSFLGHNTVTNSHFDNYTFDYVTFELLDDGADGTVVKCIDPFDAREGPAALLADL